MKNRVHTGLLLLVLAAGLTGCTGAHPPGPSAPSPQPQQTPPPTDIGRYAYNVADVLLSGVVYEVTPTGRVPIEGVLVRSDYFHFLPTPDVVTDSRGLFGFRPIWVCPCSWAPWVNPGITAIWVEKDGYEIPAGQPDSIFAAQASVKDGRLRDVTINGDTRFDIELVRRQGAQR